MIFTIEEINRNTSLLPSLKLGFSIYDSCDTSVYALKSTMMLLTGSSSPIPNYSCKFKPPTAAILGDDKSSVSISVARLLGIQQFPQISYASSVKVLSNKRLFPSFLRTTPSDDFQSYGLASLIVHFGWTWVGILADDSDYGQQGAQILVEQLEKRGVCIDFLTAIPVVYSKSRIHYISQVIKKSTVHVIIVFSSDVSFYPVITEIAKENVTGKVWIGSDGWSVSLIFNTMEYVQTMQGSLGFSIRRGNMPGFKEFLMKLHPSKTPSDVFVHRFWEKIFDCQWPSLNMTEDVKSNNIIKECTGFEQLRSLNINFFDMSDLRATYNVYNAVYAVAYALHSLTTCKPGEGPFKNNSCADARNFKPWQVLYYLKNIRFTNNMGEDVFFNENGDPPAKYDILNWKMNNNGNSLKYVNVASFDSNAQPGNEIVFNEEPVEWNGGVQNPPESVCSKMCPVGYRRAAQPGRPTCCFDCILCSEGEISNTTDSLVCIKCPDDYWSNESRDQCIKRKIEFLSFEEPLGSILTGTAVTTATIPASILIIFIQFRHTPVVKANNRELSFLLLVSLIICILWSLIFIGEPGAVTCMVRQSIFGIIFALGISCVLAKTIMVVIAFKSTKPNSKFKQLAGPRVSKSIVTTGSLIQVIICAIWLSKSPPFPVLNTKTSNDKIIFECNEGSTTAFWCMLGYMGLLASVSFVVAFLSRKLPDSFNEAKFITFSMLVFVSVWLSFIPAYLSTRGKYMVAVEVFAMLASSVGLIGCIFFPKCYIILIRPERNTRDYIMKRGEYIQNKGR
ncbi:extracellular calcium-sensing receptor-like [Bombina bombina]|uniref:extracellular calcium-sensing receptor-like n=1 Tax=Bombina bombina TaxID=8345 RepID=UPI00235B1854|nr:extracellular calcium-sensing receptor-like [Bombina bombina]